MLTTAQVERFERDGFLNAGTILAESEVDELCGELNALIEKGSDGFAEGEKQPVHFHRMISGEHGEVVQIVNTWQACAAFERLIHHPFIVRAIATLTGFDDLQVWHDQVQYKPARAGGATPWHQDAPLWPSIEPDTPVSAWLPFDDADLTNGCMWMVPGSHRWGDRIELLKGMDHLIGREEFDQISKVAFEPSVDAPIREIKAVPCPVKRGEVHFHHSLTWHGSPQNSSERPRRALAIHYMTSEARYTGRDHVMRRFIKLGVGDPMLEAGEHFPIVCRKGVPVGKDGA